MVFFNLKVKANKSAVKLFPVHTHTLHTVHILIINQRQLLSTPTGVLLYRANNNALAWNEIFQFCITTLKQVTSDYPHNVNNCSEIYIY